MRRVLIGTVYYSRLCTGCLDRQGRDGRDGYIHFEAMFDEIIMDGMYIIIMTEMRSR